MRIVNIAWIMLGTVITLFTLTGVCVVLLNDSEHRESLALQRQAEFKQLGIDLADASDYLTNEVRHYVQFGERVHYDNYWREVRETRTRDRVIQRLRELGVPQAEIELIELAKRNSDLLIAIEEEAMAAVEGRIRYRTAADVRSELRGPQEVDHGPDLQVPGSHE